MNKLFALALLTFGVATTCGPMMAWGASGIAIHTNTAAELADVCGANPREPGADARLTFCRGFAQGAIDVELHHAGDKKPFCFPRPSPTRTETMNQFVAWVRASPDRGSMPSTQGLFKFLAERYPCK